MAPTPARPGGRPQDPFIGRYRILKRLGQGGMGVVYLGADPFIERQVAIKTSLIPRSSQPEERQRLRNIFFNEARAAGRLKHPNIVSVYDAFIERGRGYLVMEYVPGLTLKQFAARERQMAIPKVVKIIFQCAKALEYAHQGGVIHRDIKPANIIISSSGEVKISDFGIAVFQDQGETSDEEMTGSVHYASPEQVRQQAPTPRSDIFSLGVVTYELVTGVRPFAAESGVATIFKLLHQEPARPRSLRPDIPESLEKAIMKALAKDPARRYKTALHLASDLIGSLGHLRFLEEEINFEKKFNVIKQLKFFSIFSSSELVEVLKNAKWIRFEAATTIIQEGEADNVFYVLVDGEAVVKKRGRVIARLRPGDCFGEMGFLARARHTATIQAARDTIVIRIGAGFFEKIPIPTQLRFHKVFTQTLIKRLAATTDRLSRAEW